jgi:hypothetical protein
MIELTVEEARTHRAMLWKPHGLFLPFATLLLLAWKGLLSAVCRIVFQCMRSEDDPSFEGSPGSNKEERPDVMYLWCESTDKIADPRSKNIGMDGFFDSLPVFDSLRSSQNYKWKSIEIFVAVSLMRSALPVAVGSINGERLVLFTGLLSAGDHGVARSQHLIRLI